MTDETAKRFAHLKCGVRTDVGRKRHNNEDSHGEWPAQGVFCVADGMGGAEGGEVASRAVVESLSGVVPGFSRFDPPLSQGDRVSAIARGVDAASAWIKSYADTQGAKGCGSTFVGVAFDPSDPASAAALHAGDSRVYRIRGKKIVQITRDHSVAEMAGVKDERELSPMFRSMILRAVGIKPSVALDTTPFDVQEGDRVVICSDGLSRMVEDREIARIVSSREDPQAAADALVDKANELGGKDNVTVVAVRVGALPPGPRPVHARLSAAEIAALVDGGGAPGDTSTGATGDETVSMETLSTGDTMPESGASAGSGPATTDDEVVLPEDEEDPEPPNVATPAESAPPPVQERTTDEMPPRPASKPARKGHPAMAAIVPALLVAAIGVGVGTREYRSAAAARHAEAERVAEAERTEEAERKAEEAAKAAKAARLAEETRKADEAAKAAEAARLAEEKRKAEEAEAARLAEEKRKAEEAEAARLAEEKRKAEEAEAARLAEKKRKAEEAEAARLAEEKRRAEEAAKAEAARLAEEKRKAEEAEAARLAEEKRKAEEAEAARLAEEKRKAEEAEAARLAEEKRRAEEAAKAEASRIAKLTTIFSGDMAKVDAEIVDLKRCAALLESLGFEKFSMSRLDELSVLEDLADSAHNGDREIFDNCLDGQFLDAFRGAMAEVDAWFRSNAAETLRKNNALADELCTAWLAAPDDGGSRNLAGRYRDAAGIWADVSKSSDERNAALFHAVAALSELRRDHSGTLASWLEANGGGDPLGVASREYEYRMRRGKPRLAFEFWLDAAAKALRTANPAR